MELLNDTFLKTFNEREGLFSENEIKGFIYGMALGLEEIHRCRVMHRDIKP